MKYPGKKISGYLALLMICLGLTGTALAHTQNEESLFGDTMESHHRSEILLLNGIGMIPAAKTFGPEGNLTMQDLAVWSALALGLGHGGEAADSAALAKAALEHGAVGTLDGDANYAAVNKALFLDRMSTDQPGSTLTREDAVAYIVEHLDHDMEGGSLLARMNLVAGPSGKVGNVETRKNPDGGTSYFITIGEETHPMYSHGRVANGPVDLKQWKDRDVSRSYLKDMNGLLLWLYLEGATAAAAQHHHH